MWIVTCDYIKGILTYFVENKETGERRGSFDCEPWAREFADELNREDEVKETTKNNTLEETIVVKEFYRRCKSGKVVRVSAHTRCKKNKKRCSA